MFKWGDVGFVDGVNGLIEGVVAFEGYLSGVVFFIFWFVVILTVVEAFSSSGDRGGWGGLVLESVWTVLPLVVLVLIAYPSLTLLYSLDSLSPSVGVSVLVVGHQWYWEYVVLGGEFTSYLDGEAGFRCLEVDSRLVLPTGEGVSMLLTSDDVIHSWALPGMGLNADCVPGRLTRMGLFTGVSGVYYGQCSELCGVLHSYMPIAVEVVSG